MNRAHQRLLDAKQIRRLSFGVFDDLRAVALVDEVGDVIADVDAVHVERESFLQFEFGDLASERFDFQLGIAICLVFASERESVYGRSHIAPFALGGFRERRCGLF